MSEEDISALTIENGIHASVNLIVYALPMIPDADL
jgi:hypothetical protein